MQHDIRGNLEDHVVMGVPMRDVGTEGRIIPVEPESPPE